MRLVVLEDSRRRPEVRRRKAGKVVVVHMLILVQVQELEANRIPAVEVGRQKEWPCTSAEDILEVVV